MLLSLYFITASHFIMNYQMRNKYHLSKLVISVLFSDTEDGEYVNLSVIEKEKGTVHIASIKKAELKRMGKSL